MLIIKKIICKLFGCNKDKKMRIIIGDDGKISYKPEDISVLLCDRCQELQIMELTIKNFSNMIMIKDRGQS